MVDVSVIWLASLSALGVAYCVSSYLEYKAVDDPAFKPFFKHKSIAIAVFVLGILVHTMGDVLSGTISGGEHLEMQFETVGHVIIMVGSIILIAQARHLQGLTGRRPDA